MLKKQGIEPDTYFADVFMLKKHDKVIAAIVQGTVAGGATASSSLALAIQQYGDIFRILMETPPIPLDAYAAGPHVTDEDCKAIQSAFLQLKADSPVLQQMEKEGLPPRAGFTVRDDAFYDVVRELSRNTK